MPLKFRVRGRALKASADGNFDENIYFDQPHGFSSWPVEEQRSNDRPLAVLDDGEIIPSSRLHAQRPQQNKVWKDEAREGSKTNMTFDTSLESSSPSSPFPKMQNSNDNIDKRGKFKFMKFRRKNRKETPKSKSREESRKQKGMALLHDDVDQDSMGGYSPSWGTGEYGSSSEKGLQINFSESPLQSADNTNHGFVESSPVSVNNDGFFTDAALDFQSAFDQSTKFSPLKSNAHFDSFEAADDWDLLKGSFDSFNGGKEQTFQEKHAQNFEEGTSTSNQFSPSSPEPSEGNNDDSEYIGPIDSDTLEKWKDDDDDDDDDDAKVLHHVPAVKRDISQLWILHTPDRNGHNQDDSTKKIDMSIEPYEMNYDGTTPIDVDTLEPWTPKQHVKPITTEPVLGEEPNDSNDLSRHPHNEECIQNDLRPPLNIQGGTAALTLGMLAQISGLVDYDVNNNDQYWRAATDHDDNLNEEDAAAEIANASKKTIEEHEQAGPNVSASAFHSPSPEKIKSHDVPPSASGVENEYAYEIDNISSFSSFQSNSPFKTNLSGIHNQSSHHFPHEEASGDLTPSRDLEDGPKNGYYDEGFVEAEQEMTQILSQFHLDESNNIASDQKEENDDNYVSNVRNFWKQKDKQTPSKQYISPTNEFHNLQSVEWPSPSADSPIGQGQEVLKDDIFSRNKTTKPLDVPISVTAKPSGEMSFATELSSLCEQSFDLTEDGFQVPKREAAKDVYRATKTSNSSYSSKGFFWRSHPDGPTSTCNNEDKTQKHHNDPKVDKVGKKTSAVDLYLKRVKTKRNDVLDDPQHRTTTPNPEKSSGRVIQNSSIPNDHSSAPTNQPTKVMSTSNEQSVTTHDTNQGQNKHLPDKSTIGKKHTQDKGNNISPSIQWKKAIEAKIISTSERIKAARHQTTSPTFNASTKNHTTQTIPKRAPSPFQANKNSFLNKWQAQATMTTTSLSSSNHVQEQQQQQQQDDSKSWNGIPILIEKNAVDDDAISGCSSSIADRIKHFESKSQNSKQETTGRSTPLNSFSLSKLRTMTNNVGGLWS